MRIFNLEQKPSANSCATCAAKGAHLEWRGFKNLGVVLLLLVRGYTQTSQRSRLLRAFPREPIVTIMAVDFPASPVPVAIRSKVRSHLKETGRGSPARNSYGSL